MLRLRRLERMQDIVDWDLCTGCGACYGACDKDAVTLSNVPDRGIRPILDDAKCAACGDCLSICPGSIVDARQAEALNGRYSPAGPALAIFEGHAVDPEIRFNASSGGLLSAIAAFCIESGEMGEVWHTGVGPETPWLNVPRVSRSRKEILENCGSRYAPASPCELFRTAPEGSGPAVFIGKPCDVAAARALIRGKPEQEGRIGLMLSFCCAGTPSTKATLDLISMLCVSPESVSALRYRGRGWPGEFTLSFGEGPQEKKLSYEESWGRLSKKRPLRCICCPDGLGMLSDITCGDAWHKSSEAGNGANTGLSIAIARTKKGHEVLQAAQKAGYISLRTINEEDVVRAQKYLIRKHRELLGRSFAMRLFAMPVTTYHGFNLWPAWKSLHARGMLRSVIGTLQRIIRRGLWRRSGYRM